MTTQSPSPGLVSPSRVLLDGFTAHVACLKDIPACDYRTQLNPISQASFSSLIQALILHDVVLVGKDVIGPSARLSTLFQIFGPALEESPSIPKSAQIKFEYEGLKRDYLCVDGIDEVYEEGLTTLVQRHCFEGLGLRRVDKKLMKLLVLHSALRTRMYVQLAFVKGIPYVPSPYRRRLFNDPGFVERSKCDCVGTSRLDLLAKVRSWFDSPSSEDKESNDNSCNVDPDADVDAISNDLIFVPFEIPAFMEMVLQNSHSHGILTTARQIRDSKEARDFRALLSALFTADQTGIKNDAEHDLKLLAHRWKAKSTIDGARDMSRSIDGCGRPVKRRAAYIFLHNILQPNRKWPSLWRGPSGFRRIIEGIASWSTRQNPKRRLFS